MEGGLICGPGYGNAGISGTVLMEKREEKKIDYDHKAYKKKVLTELRSAVESDSSRKS